MSGDCLGEENLAAWASGRLDTPDAQRAREHLEECSDCRLLCDLVERGRPTFSQGLSLKPGEKLGPYTLLEWVGQGGMGDVFAAYDARLDRRVALKVLSGSRVAALGHAAKERILHEARAMAQLNHPNVATVFDVGEERGIPYLAMEFLPGGNLRAWQDQPRTLEETLVVFTEVARGLGHAHARGVVHRDFKPANVVFDAEQVPRVTDFGLAALGEPHEQGVVVGTRGFLAPEVERGEPATPAADQFAFGVALRQAIAATGARPSPKLHATLEKLTAPQPLQRFESMVDAASALFQCQPSTRRRRLRKSVILVLATALLVASSGAALQHLRRCDAAGDPARALKAEVARRIPLALASLEQRTGARLAPPVLAELTRQLAEWEKLSNEVCHARTDPASAAIAQLRESCATVGLDAVSTYVAWLETVPPLEPAIAWERLMELPPSDACRLLRADDAAAWSEVGSQRQRLQVQAVLSRIEGQLPVIDEEKADPLPRALALAARVTSRSPCADEALMQEAISAARRAHHHVELKLWGQLASCQSARGGLREAGFSVGMGEEVASALSPSAPARVYFDLLRVRVLNQGGRVDEAEALATRTVETTRLTVGDNHWLHAMAQTRRGEVWMMRGRFAEVAQTYRAALPLLERAFGPDDLRVLHAHHNLGSALAANHLYEEALREYLPLLEREGGWSNSPLTSDLVPVMLALGRKEEALKLGRAAISEISERDPAVFSRKGQQLMAWAMAELAAGSPGEVLRRMRVTLELERLGAAPYDVAVVYRVFEAGALRRLGRARDGMAVLDAIRLDLRQAQQLTPTEQLLSAERVRCLVELGRTPQAQRELAALDLESSGGMDPLERARLWQLVARALDSEGKSTEAAPLWAQAQRAIDAIEPRPGQPFSISRGLR
jgi:serine/threonine protein kinase/tetratricopeptide (TPR) repeat protein